jgi:hypothetical protein
MPRASQKAARPLRAWALAALALLSAATAAGCTHLTTLRPGEPPAAHLPQGPAPERVAALAPVFAVQNPGDGFNLIGRPTASRDPSGYVWVRMDTGRPAVYYQAREFTTARGSYTNLIYRVHFPGTPASLLPLLIGWGKNNGLLVVVTLDRARRPVLIATAGTCGCYLSLTATQHTPDWALPAGFEEGPQRIYGETLPSRLEWPAHSRLVVTVAPAEHRVAGLAALAPEALAAGGAFAPRPAELLPAERLEELELAGGGRASLFYPDGPLAGHVRGAHKPLETLLLGIPSLDLWVGADKAYGRDDNPFYTSLKPWARQASDLNHYPRFLRYWGWRL